MAFLTESRLFIADASNVPLNGGKARIYDANTTNLTSVFSDAALAVPLTNPVVADSSGITPQIFAAEGTTVDIQYLTSAGATVAGRSYVDVVFVGADTADFTRTVTGSGRIKITGAAGAVNIQAAQASPDNVGGDLTLEGCVGTQLDTLTLDAAATSTTGSLAVGTSLTVGGLSIPSVVASGTMAAAASLAVELIGSLHSYTLELYDITPSTTATLSTTVSIDNQATYVAGAAYTGYYVAHDATPGGGASGSSWPGTISNILATAGYQNLINLNIDTPLSGTGQSALDSYVSNGSATGNTWYRVGGSVSAGGRITHVKFTTSSGTFTCKWRLKSRGS